MIALRPLRQDEFDDWGVEHRAEYERGLVESAGMKPDAAKAKVEHDVPSVLPDGLATPGT